MKKLPDAAGDAAEKTADAGQQTSDRTRYTSDDSHGLGLDTRIGARRLSADATRYGRPPMDEAFVKAVRLRDDDDGSRTEYPRNLPAVAAVAGGLPLHPCLQG